MRPSFAGQLAASRPGRRPRTKVPANCFTGLLEPVAGQLPGLQPAERAPGDGPAVDLRRPVVDAEGADLVEQPTDGRVRRDAQRAAHLDAAVGDAKRRLGDEGLRYRGQRPGRAVAVELVGRLP